MIASNPPDAASPSQARHNAVKRAVDSLFAAARFVRSSSAAALAAHIKSDLPGRASVRPGRDGGVAASRPVITRVEARIRPWMESARAHVIGAVYKRRRALVVAVHLVLIVLANYMAFWLRFDGSIPEREMTLFVEMLPLLVTIVGLSFVPFRLYGGLWRYTGIWDLRSIIAGVTAGSGGFFVAVHWILRVEEYPRSVYVMEPVLLILLMGGRHTRRRPPINRIKRTGSIT